jgi:WXG100 family type VII secretion target
MPNFTSTDVDSKVVSDAAASIDNFINELQSIAKAIESGIMPSLNPYWQGQARDRFEQKINSCSIDLSSLVAGYRELNEQLKKAGTEYNRADGSVRQIVANLPR